MTEGTERNRTPALHRMQVIAWVITAVLLSVAVGLAVLNWLEIAT